ncbi:MAG: hypothetical protein V7K26_15545 [Nostoc sp.]|uniref:hypothetical protein n=1 Tax=Nostoc sp. TaxID=1180 RepID=UPI002FF3B286
MVKNLHGSRMKEFWEKANAEKREPNSEKEEPNSGDSDKDAGCEEIRALNQASILGKDQSEQGFQETSRTNQEHLTISFEEIVRCISDTLTKISRVEETASAPLGGASPQTVESVSENEEELPVAMDCTSLALVDAVPSQSVSLLAKNLSCSVEPKNCHESTCSAAPVAQNEKSLTSAIADQKIEPSCPSAELMTENSVSGVEMKADHEGEGSAASVTQNEKSLNSAMPAAGVAIANQAPELVEQGNSATLLVENSVSGVEVKTVDKGESSAPPVSQTEKWSHEAIVARSNMRPVRRERLNRAANSGENPGLDFLQECWSDDPALQIAIKKLLAKFPQWGIAVVDGVLVD